MIPSEKIVREWLSEAICRVHRDQEDLWISGVGERARVGQIFLALHETHRFDGGWAVDLEWNREGSGGDPKQQAENRSGYGTPDIAVHHRGKTGPEHNLVIVEFKNSLIRGKPSEFDRKKVSYWMRKYSYRYGAVISLGPNEKTFGPQGFWLTHSKSKKRDMVEHDSWAL